MGKGGVSWFCVGIPKKRFFVGMQCTGKIGRVQMKNALSWGKRGRFSNKIDCDKRLD
jgi:hypothetical protein